MNNNIGKFMRPKKATYNDHRSFNATMDRALGLSHNSAVHWINGGGVRQVVGLKVAAAFGVKPSEMVEGRWHFVNTMNAFDRDQFARDTLMRIQLMRSADSPYCEDLANDIEANVKGAAEKDRDVLQDLGLEAPVADRADFGDHRTIAYSPDYPDHRTQVGIKERDWSPVTTIDDLCKLLKQINASRETLDVTLDVSINTGDLTATIKL